MNRESMPASINFIQRPYCAQFHRQLADPNLLLWLMMDNQSSHNRDEVIATFRTKNIDLIWFPPHSAHFLQVLDLLLFDLVQGNSNKLQKLDAKSKLERTIVRELHAWHEASWLRSVLSAWRMAGFHVDLPDDSDVWNGIDLKKIAQLMTQNCPEQGKTTSDILNKFEIVNSPNHVAFSGRHNCHIHSDPFRIDDAREITFYEYRPKQSSKVHLLRISKCSLNF
jgi:hypothetical protein